MLSVNEINNNDERDSEFVDRLVFINRVSTVVKGGRRFSFAALVVVGDQKGLLVLVMVKLEKFLRL